MYLIPPAYRKRDPEFDDKKTVFGKLISNRGKNGNDRSSSKNHHFRRPQPHSGGHPRGSSPSPSPPVRRHWKKSRHNNMSRHNILSGHRGSMRRIKASFKEDGANNEEFGYLDIGKMQKLEKSLSRKLNEYNSRLGGISTLDFTTYAEKSASKEEAERNPTPSSFSLLESESNESIDDFQSGPHVQDLLATEESYISIAADLKTLIIGWSEIAESMCAAKRIENAHRDDSMDDDKSEGSLLKIPDYENAAVQAESHLQSFETLFRDRENAVAKGKSFAEDLARKKEEANKINHSKVMGKVTSFLGDVFSVTSKASTTAEFDESWQRADGLSPKVDEIQRENTPSNFDDKIVAHKNTDSIPGTSLYEYVLLANQASYSFGKKAKEESARRSNRLLNRWISVHCRARPNDAAVGAINNNNNDIGQLPSISPDLQSDVEFPEQKLFHTVMRQNSDLFTMDGAKRTEDWLRTMQSLKRSGWDNCGPDVNAYNLVLLAFKNLCNFRFTKASEKPYDVANNSYEKEKKAFIIEGVERILLELNSLADDGITPNVLSLNLTLASFAKIGHRDNSTIISKMSDRLLHKVIGEEKYRNLIVDIESHKKNEVGETLDEIESINPPESGDNIDEDLNREEVKNLLNDASKYVSPNLDTYHWLVDIYSASGDINYVKRGLHLLKRMIQIRMDTDFTVIGEHGNVDQFAPSTGTFNNVLRSLQRNTFDIELAEYKNLPNALQTRNHDKEFSRNQVTDIAKEVTGFLDSMVQYESSLPSRGTYALLIQLWSKTDSPEAGDYAENILSRMEIMGMCENDTRPHPNAYFLAMHCWLAAAKAGRCGAAERASRLLGIMNAQYGAGLSSGRQTDESSDETLESESDDEVYDKTMRPNRSFYTLLLKICSHSREKSETSQSMDIAFESYNKMIENGIKPNRATFVLMYQCVVNYLDHHPREDKNKLMQKVFDCAYEHGVTRKEVIERRRRQEEQY